MSPKFSESKFHSAKSQNTMLITILFFFIIVFLQFSIKFYFSGCLVLITNSKLVICVGKRRGFSRRLWLLIKELLIARDADRRNKTPYINVSFLEFDFLESHIFLENPPFSPTVDLDSQKKETIPYPRCGFGVCLRCERAF